MFGEFYFISEERQREQGRNGKVSLQQFLDVQPGKVPSLTIPTAASAHPTKSKIGRSFDRFCPRCTAVREQTLLPPRHWLSPGHVERKYLGICYSLYTEL